MQLSSFIHHSYIHKMENLTSFWKDCLWFSDFNNTKLNTNIGNICIDTKGKLLMFIYETNSGKYSWKIQFQTEIKRSGISFSLTCVSPLAWCPFWIVKHPFKWSHFEPRSNAVDIWDCTSEESWRGITMYELLVNLLKISSFYLLVNEIRFLDFTICIS